MTLIGGGGHSQPTLDHLDCIPVTLNGSDAASLTLALEVWSAREAFQLLPRSHILSLDLKCRSPGVTEANTLPRGASSLCLLSWLIPGHLLPHIVFWGLPSLSASIIGDPKLCDTLGVSHLGHL